MHPSRPRYPLFPRRLVRTRRASAAFTLIELLTVIAIIGILAAILIPVVGKVRESAKNATCLSNLRELGGLSQLYVADHRSTIPPCVDQSLGADHWWHRLLAVYLGDKWTGNEFTEKRRVLYGCGAYANGPESGAAFKFWNPGYGVKPLSRCAGVGESELGGGLGRHFERAALQPHPHRASLAAHLHR